MQFVFRINSDRKIILVELANCAFLEYHYPLLNYLFYFHVYRIKLKNHSLYYYECYHLNLNMV
jgi:hypothetical protein